jgi:hypothetical protein
MPSCTVITFSTETGLCGKYKIPSRVFMHECAQHPCLQLNLAPHDSYDVIGHFFGGKIKGYVLFLP